MLKKRRKVWESEYLGNPLFYVDFICCYSSSKKKGATFKDNFDRTHYNYRERLEKLGLNTLLERRMIGDLIEITNYDRYVVQYFFSNWKFTIQKDFKN